MFRLIFFQLMNDKNIDCQPESNLGVNTNIVIIVL